jgi:hypothetical protein
MNPQLQRPPARWESWVQATAIVATLVVGSWNLRGMLDQIAWRQQVMVVHLCRIEVVLHQVSFQECQQLMLAPTVKADP